MTILHISSNDEKNLGKEVEVIETNPSSSPYETGREIGQAILSMLSPKPPETDK